jgi:hypothetical protein
MTAGRLAASNPAAATKTLLYQAPITAAASTVLTATNLSASAASSYNVYLKDYTQILTLDANTYQFRKGNVISSYKLTISPGISAYDFTTGQQFTLTNGKTSFKFLDIVEEKSTKQYYTKRLPVLSAPYTGIAGGSYAIGGTVSNGLGITATIVDDQSSILYVTIADTASSATTLYFSQSLTGVTGITNAIVSLDGSEVATIGSVTGRQMTVTRGQLGTTAIALPAGTTAEIYPLKAASTTTSGIDASSTTFTLASTTGIFIGDYVKCENELMYVNSVDGLTQLTVTRGQVGTTAATHAASTAVTSYDGSQNLDGYVGFFADADTLTSGSVTSTADITTVSNQIEYVFDTTSGAGTGPYKFFSSGLPLLSYRTYRFNQSDTSNTSAPLRFSVDDGVTELTTGVTTSGTPGNSGAYVQIAVTPTTVGKNPGDHLTGPSTFAYVYYNDTTPTDGSGGSGTIDINPLYSQIYVYDVTANPSTLAQNDEFTAGTELQNIDSITTGAYGYVQSWVSSTSKLYVSLGINSSAFAGTNTFYDHPTNPGDARGIATVSSVTANTDTVSSDTLVFKKSVTQNNFDKNSSIVVGPGQVLVVMTETGGDVAYQLNGFEDVTTDYTLNNYKRIDLPA